MLQRYKIFLNGCNITTFFNTIHSFFCRKITKNTLKTTFYLNVTKTKTLLEDTKIELPSKERDRKLGFIGHGAV